MYMFFLVSQRAKEISFTLREREFFIFVTAKCNIKLDSLKIHLEAMSLSLTFKNFKMIQA